jgi:hypothetical protein
VRTIDVHDLPEPMARAIADTVESLKAQMRKRQNGTQPLEPTTWPLGVKGRLSREEIYDHLDE